jgi:starch synthase (maltosyl-transferring)
VGGAERCLVDLAVRLDRTRFDPVVYCLGPRPTAEESSCVPPLEQAGIEVQCLGATGKKELVAVIRRLTRLLAERRTSLIQSFLFHANLVGRIAARRAGVGCVLSGIRVAERQQRWHVWLDRLTSRWVDRYVCVSQSVAQFSIDRGGLPAAKMAVIPNGIDLSKYPSECCADLSRFGVPPGRRVVCCVGRLESQKGVRWLLETAPRWLERVPDCDLLLVGKGPEQPELERMAAASGLGARIHFAGWQSEVPAILAASTLLVLPSQWEGMPNVVLQAMASRLPVVATEVEGVRELLGPQTEGQTVSYGDSRGLTEAIVRLLSHPQQAAQLAEENRLRVESQFTLERMVAAYQELWESLLAGKKAV